MSNPTQKPNQPDAGNAAFSRQPNEQSPPPTPETSVPKQAHNPKTIPAKSNAANAHQPSPVVKMFGVGNAGLSIVERMMDGPFNGATFAAVNVDSRSLDATVIQQKLLLEKKLLRGLGTGGDPDRGRAAAEEHFQKLKDACAGVNVALIVAGLGGGAGTGISPVLARAARESGALTIALVTLPFDCEGNRRQKQAREGLETLRAASDGVICIPNQKVFKLIDENTSVLDTFRKTTDLLLDGARGLWRLIKHRGMIEIHFDELCSVLRDRHGESCVVAVETSGDNRASAAAEQLFTHPLLEGEDLDTNAGTVLVSLIGGPDLTMADINRVMSQISQRCGRAQITMGAAVDETFREKLCVTLIAGRRAPSVKKPTTTSTGKDATPELDTQLLEKQSTAKPASRLVPPPPVLTPEQQSQLLGRQSGGRQRNSGPRFKQTQLPLEIVNKGRFDNSEPTIYKGEDLDIPTFIRRGMVMN